MYSPSTLFFPQLKTSFFSELWQIQFTTVKGILELIRAESQDLSESRSWSEKSALNI